MGCAGGYEHLPAYLHKHKIPPPTAELFYSCRGYGCKYIEIIELTKNEWKQIDRPFLKKSKSAEDEREKIAQAIASFEEIVGEITGTHEDKTKTFKQTGPYQQDCVDESTNTSIYLSVLFERGHIKFHEIAPPSSRVPIASPVSWPHQTAIIIETETGDHYAVDSWFHDNGQEPEIIPHVEWKRGWKPEEKPADISS